MKSNQNEGKESSQYSNLLDIYMDDIENEE